LLLSKRSKFIAAGLTRWTGSVPEIISRKIKKGPGKGRTNFLPPFTFRTRPKGPVLLGTADFRGSLSDLSDLSSGTFYVGRCSRANPTQRELHRTAKAANSRRSSIKSTQKVERTSVRPLRHHGEGHILFHFGHGLRKVLHHIQLMETPSKGTETQRSWSLKDHVLLFRTQSRPRQSQLPAFVKQGIRVGSVRKGHVLV
jgi:hypothetical protein